MLRSTVSSWQDRRAPSVPCSVERRSFALAVAHLPFVRARALSTCSSRIVQTCAVRSLQCGAAGRCLGTRSPAVCESWCDFNVLLRNCADVRRPFLAVWSGGTLLGLLPFVRVRALSTCSSRIVQTCVVRSLQCGAAGRCLGTRSPAVCESPCDFNVLLRNCADVRRPFLAVWSGGTLLGHSVSCRL